MSEDVRELVTVRTIDSIEPIENADAIEKLNIGGWVVVSRKGIHQPGDQVVYFEIDSALPLDNPLFTDLGARGKKLIDGKEYHILKTVRLRGVYSQGFVIPMREVQNFLGEPPEITEYYESLTEALGVIKDEPSIPMSLAGHIAGKFPTNRVLKTDSERIQNLKGDFQSLKEEFSWFPTEKIDGSSITILKDEDGTLRVCSRNWELKPPAEGESPNTFWKVAQSVANSIPEGFIIQGEVYGEGIQGNRLKVKGQKLAVFNVFSPEGPVAPVLWPEDLFALAVPELPLELPDTVEEAIAQVDGIKSQINPQALAEGVVWHEARGRVPQVLGRSNFKVISNKYLLKG